MNTDTPPVITHTDDPHCVCASCRSERAMRRMRARRADRDHSARHMVDPDILRDRR